jgi:hypothetical protein
LSSFTPHYSVGAYALSINQRARTLSYFRQFLGIYDNIKRLNATIALSISTLLLGNIVCVDTSKMTASFADGVLEV